MCSSSLRARCRPHTASPDLPIIRSPSTRPVRPSPFLCTRYPTPTTILVTVLNLNSNLAKSMTHHTQTKELTTWCLTFSPRFVDAHCSRQTSCMETRSFTWIVLYKSGQQNITLHIVTLYTELSSSRT
jgi:hypothetical protein